MNSYSIFPLISALLSLVLGFFIYFRNRKSVLNITFGLTCITTAWWQFSWFILFNVHDEHTALLIVKIGYSGIVFIPVTFFHFCACFLGPRGLDKKLITTSYVLGVTFVLLLWNTTSFIDGVYKFYWGYYPRAGSLHPAYLTLLFILVARAIYIQLSSLRRVKFIAPYKYAQVKYLLLSSMFYVPAATDFMTNYGLELYPLGFFFTSSSSIVIAYTIFRHRLMDIKVAVKKTMVYSLSAGLLTGVLVILVHFLSKILTDLAGSNALGIYILAALVIALLFNPLRERIQSLIDKLFYKASYDYYTVIQRVGNELSSKIYEKDIQKIVTDTIFSTLKLRDAYFLCTGKKNYSTVYYKKLDRSLAGDEKTPRIKGNGALVGLLQETRDVVVIEELPNLIGPERAAPVARETAPFRGEVAVPILIDGEMKAMILLGGKISGDPFSDGDVNLLRTIAGDTSLSLKSALLYAEKLRSERLATLGSTAATLAHEIKNPLSSIKTFTQLLPEKYGDREFRETFSMIVPPEIERIDRLVTELLMFTKRAPSGQHPGDIEPIAVMEECLKLMSEQIHKEGIAVIKHFETPFSIKGDPDRLKQALLNIIANSCQAMPGGGKLKISAGFTNNKGMVAVEDTGVGISEHDLEKIFDPFFTTKDMGNGLGLTISKKIIEEHGGSISVASKQGEGTVLTLLFDPAEALAGERRAEQPKLWN